MQMIMKPAAIETEVALVRAEVLGHGLLDVGVDVTE